MRPLGMSDANFQELGRFVSHATLPTGGWPPENASRVVGLSLLLGEVVISRLPWWCSFG